MFKCEEQNECINERRENMGFIEPNLQSRKRLGRICYVVA